MVYSRAIDPAKLGLSPEGAVNAMKHGQQLAASGFIPNAIITGIDQRNRDGGRFSAEGIKQVSGVDVPIFTSPAVTYPHYRDPFDTSDQMEKYGDGAVHRSLNGQLQLWSEERTAFATRVLSAVKAEYPWANTVLFDLNFEQMVLLYHTLLKKLALDDIPSDGWCPQYGEMIVIANDGTVALFNAKLEFVE
jgi:hypothetical protein